MEFKPKPELRTPGPGGAPAGPPAAPPAPPAEPSAPPEARPAPPEAPFALNPISELVADLLAATGLLSPDRLALVRGRAGQGSIAQAIVDENLASSDGIARILASRFRLPFVDLAVVTVDTEAVGLIPMHVLERVVAIPYRLDGDRLQMAIAEPQNVQTIDELRLATRHQLDLGVAAHDSIVAELQRIVRRSEAHAVSEAIEAEVPEALDEVGAEVDLEAADGVSDGPLVRLVNSVIFQAAEDGASDIHFEPQEDSLLVRFRVDGVLHEVQRIPKRLIPGVTTRLKVLAKLDIAERRKPQDGRISLNAAAAGRMLDVRVASLPTVEGESIVMRLLDKSKRAPSLSEIGLADGMRERLVALLERPTGSLLVTGPTGTGKSTTLYAALEHMNRPEINIITVEDPVEYRMSGVNQIQINVRAGLTFATALRSILRSDPDVVMVGEIRDAETAKISIEAALTGHFVLSTLHTSDAPSVLTRLNEMGVEPFLTGAAVSAVLAQRLARQLCTHCCEMYTPTTDELIKQNVSPDVAASLDGAGLYRKRGCPRCGQTGYRGRIGVFQLLTMSSTLEELAARKSSREEIERAAIEAGMRTLWDDGMAKVAAGLTSIEELARVVMS